MSDIENQVRWLLADIRAKDAIILALAEKLEICSRALSRCAERKILSEIPQITVDSYRGASVHCPQTDANPEPETTMSTTNFRNMVKAARKVIRNGGCTTAAHRAAMETCEHKNDAVKQDAGWEAVKLAR